MADANATETLDLIEAAARQQMGRDFDGLERLLDNADQVAARSIAEATANLERTLTAAGVDPKSSESP